MKRGTWLTLRRTYSSWAHQKGVPGKVVAQLMGHAKVDTTLNVYTQVIDGALRAAAERVGAELFTIVHKPAGSPELIHNITNECGSPHWTISATVSLGLRPATGDETRRWTFFDPG